MSRRSYRAALCGGVLLVILGVASAAPGASAAFGRVKGRVHDLQGAPIASAQVVIHAAASDWTRSSATAADGAFDFALVPVGIYTVTGSATGFGNETRRVEVTADSVATLDLGLSVAAVTAQVTVAGDTGADSKASSPHALVSRQDIARTPGADDANSLGMIATAVPGASMVHDQLHVRGGHQVAWLLDGVPVPNTNIATNVGPQIAPGDIDYLEIQRGGYSAAVGDRAYGVFDVVPRTGFERRREAEVTFRAGTFASASGQVSAGSHTDRFAYYGSMSGNRTDLGLMPATADVVHDRATGLGGFASLVFNATAHDQVRFASSIRRDTYQIPTSPEAETGASDLDKEQDAVAVGSWLHAFGDRWTIALSPFFHRNRADLIGGTGDAPIATTDRRLSVYGGGQVELTAGYARHSLRLGGEAFGQRDTSEFLLEPADGSPAIDQHQTPGGRVAAVFAEDQFTAASWLTINAGVRATRFSAAIAEGAVSPRIGLAARLPHAWVARAYYGWFYQPPPLDTVVGPLLQFAAEEGFGYLPLRGERDRQAEISLTVPVRHWQLDLAAFRTDARHFFDHDALGNSNIFLPLTIDRARIRGVEASVSSPPAWNRVRVRLNYSLQYTEGRGAISGGLTDFSPPAGEYFFLDHDQRHTFSGVVTLTLRQDAWITAAMTAGSGFLDGDGPGHLPAYGTIDVAAGRSFGKQWALKATVQNVTNRRYFIDMANTFGGTHFSFPRRVSVEVQYRFHY